MNQFNILGSSNTNIDFLLVELLLLMLDIFFPVEAVVGYFLLLKMLLLMWDIFFLLL